MKQSHRSPNLPKNWLTRLSYPRICHLRDIVASRIWAKEDSFSLGFALGPNVLQPGRCPSGSEFLSSYKPGSSLGERFTYRWLELRIPQLPPVNSWLRLEGKECEINFWIGNHLAAGFDGQHPRHPVPCEGGLARLEILLFRDDATLDVAQIETRNEYAWQAWNDLDILCEAVRLELESLQRSAGYPEPMAFTYSPSLDNASRPLRRLLARLEQAADVFDREGIAALADETEAILREFPHDPQRLRIAATGHSHLDLAWLWPRHASTFKAAHTFASMQCLLEKYPEFRFGYSQPCSYEAVQHTYPSVAEQTRELIQAGRWEPEGALYVEADTNLPCGEALLRCFTVGQASFTSLSGKRSTITWLPDVFGFTGCLPRLMKETGSEFLFTTKMHWNPVTFFPHSSFRWQGIDGSEVLVHLAQHSMGYILDARVKEFRNIEQVYRQSAIHDQAIGPVGFGDGGGGTTYEQLERMRRLKDFYFCPPAEWVSLRSFFTGLDQVKSELPAYAGELYLEYHRGVFTTQGKAKSAYRDAEKSLQTEEAIRALEGMGPVPAEKWKTLLFFQFHDVLPGTSCREVYRDEIPLLVELKAGCLAETQELMGRNGNDLVLFNPHAYSVSRIIGGGESLQLVDAPALSISRADECVREPRSRVQITSRELNNGLVRAVLSEDGYLSELEILGRKILFSDPAAKLAIYPENPVAFDAWEIDRQSLSNGEWVDTASEIETISEGNGLRGILKVSRCIRNASRVTTFYTLDAESDILRIDFVVDWKDPQLLLKVHFPTLYRGKMARFGTPFGSILRPQLPAMPSDETQWEVPGSRWAQITDDSETDGLFVVTEAKYGFSCRDGDLTVSLLRSPKDPDGVNVKDCLKAGWESDYTDIGEHHIRLAIGAVRGIYASMQLHPAAVADWLYTNPIRGTGHPGLSPLPAIEWPQTVIPCWVKPCESRSGFLVRAHEVGGRRGQFFVSPKKGWTVCKSNASEDIALDITADVLSVAYHPYDLVTLLFQPADS